MRFAVDLEVIKVITGVFLTETMKVASMDDSRLAEADRRSHDHACLSPNHDMHRLAHTSRSRSTEACSTRSCLATDMERLGKRSNWQVKSWTRFRELHYARLRRTLERNSHTNIYNYLLIRDVLGRVMSASFVPGTSHFTPSAAFFSASEGKLERL